MKKRYTMTFIVGHNNKCNLVGLQYIYYNVVNIQAYLYNQEKNINKIKIYIYYASQQ